MNAFSKSDEKDKTELSLRPKLFEKKERENFPEVLPNSEATEKTNTLLSSLHIHEYI